ncbi:MAG TPA: hypothetical protein VMU84_12155 [Thermoanaerobaculia bacterium]|nr:hypothetical protein [Thermoanaerobaculia bacterium]
MEVVVKKNALRALVIVLLIAVLSPAAVSADCQWCDVEWHQCWDCYGNCYPLYSNCGVSEFCWHMPNGTVCQTRCTGNPCYLA